MLVYPIETIVIGLCFNCYFTKNDNPLTYHVNDQKRLILSNDVGLNAAKISFYNIVKKLSLKHKIIILHDNPVDDRFDRTYIVGSSSNGKSTILITSNDVEDSSPTHIKQTILEKKLMELFALKMPIPGMIFYLRKI